ncbi:von Willebrand factor type A domain-containing protein [Hydrogenivirga caldilitoris]|uniref:von Willebrand factor type A domain-containing protein n=1 Tax=Hydrogenivirga caldilitoris TaxID=246264 RepID=A0A497XP34_9AQUI|nr:VWA domain-containing protein [Hydrogenivirga caldilitoris]RLJ70736.1 von Willebrand factor type A domain-containing protein [Hydrogenivirga caldilitoris]
MKERWKVIANLLEDEFDIEVQPSYEGWGAGYDPKFLPVIEMWARGEVEDIPHAAKTPRGVVFNIVEFLRKTDDYTINSVRHEISYLLSTHFPSWRFGQREVFRAGYVPTSFLTLYAVLESIKANERITEEVPSAVFGLKAILREVLEKIETTYPHHQLALSLAYRWLGEEVPFSQEIKHYTDSMEKSFYEYIREKDPQTAYDIVMEELWSKYRVLVDEAKELNHIDLLIEEAKGRKREDGHRGRIMTDILRKLPDKYQSLIQEYKEKTSIDIPEVERRELLKVLNSIQDWMKDYVKQMSYLDLLEKDIAFLKHFLPKTLEVDVEHRGFLSFLFKGWDEESSLSNSMKLQEIHDQELSEMDRKYRREHGLTEEEFKRYQLLMKSILPYVEHFKRKFDNLLPEEEEHWGGSYMSGKRLNFKRLPTEVPIRRGKIYTRREIPERKELAFELLIDISASMKKEEKIINAVRSLLLVSEVLNKLKMPFSIKVFNENVYELKDFEEDYRIAKAKIMELVTNVGGGTDLGKAINIGLESLELYIKSTHRKGILILFTDGEPTKGMRNEELKSFILQMKQKFPIVGVGVGEATRMVKDYFDRTGISVEDVSKLPSAFSFVVENQLRRLLSVS